MASASMSVRLSSAKSEYRSKVKGQKGILRICMSHKNHYLLTSFVCGIVTLVLAVILTGVKIRESDGLEKYNKARWCPVAALAVFSVLNLLEIASVP